MKLTNAPRPEKRGAGHDDGVPRSHAGHRHSADEMHNEAVAHEHMDVNMRAVLGSAIALTVVTAVVYVLMYWLFGVFDNNALANKVDVSPLSRPATEMPRHIVGPEPFGSAPQPRLLTNEPAVLEQLRVLENTQLHGYGWVDEKAGVARVPIAEAKRLLLERGLAVRDTAAAKDPTLGTSRPAMAESSSGRTANGPPRGTGLPDVK